MVPLLFPTVRAFDLGRLGTDLIARWSALDYATKMTDAGAGAISQWTDSAAGISVTDNATAGNRPTYSATAFNSAYPGLTFDGTSDCLVNTADTILNSMGATECDIFAMVAGVNDSTARTFIQFGSITAGANRVMRKNATSNTMLIGDSTTNINGPASPTLVSPAICNGQFQTVVYRARVNGVQNVNSTAATLNTGGGTLRIRIGSNNANTAGAFWSGVLSEILITKFQTEQRRQAIEGYLAWLYGIQASLAPGHPYREKRP